MQAQIWYFTEYFHRCHDGKDKNLMSLWRDERICLPEIRVPQHNSIGRSRTIDTAPEPRAEASDVSLVPRQNLKLNEARDSVDVDVDLPDSHLSEIESGTGSIQKGTLFHVLPAPTTERGCCAPLKAVYGWRKDGKVRGART